MKPGLRDIAPLVFKGACMGTADAIPGVSGGTVALILGVYHRLIEGIRSFNPKTVLALLRALPGLWNPSRREALIAAAKALHLDFLIPLGLGVVPAIGVATRVLPGLIERHRSFMFALFFGMILASTWVPFSRMPTRAPQHLLALLAGAASAWVLVGFSVQTTPTLPFIFLCGAIAICAMILPGVSGSYLLQALGQYRYISEALHSLDVVTIGVFLCGIGVGITVFVRILSWMLHKAEALTLALLTGLMIGSLRSVWPYQVPTGETYEHKGRIVHIMRNTWPQAWGGSEVAAAALVLVGAAIVVALIRVDRQLGDA